MPDPLVPGYTVPAFRFRLHLIVFLAAGALFVCFGFIVGWTEYEKLFKAGLSLAGAGFVMHGAIFARQLTAWQAAARLEQLRTDKLGRTFEVLQYLENGERVDRRIELFRVFWDRTNDRPKDSRNGFGSVEERIDEDQNLQICLGKTLGSLEDLSLMIQHHYVDEKLVFDSMGGVVRKVYEIFSPWVTARQKVNPLVYVHFLQLAVAWGGDKPLGYTGIALSNLPPPETPSWEGRYVTPARAQIAQ